MSIQTRLFNPWSPATLILSLLILACCSLSSCSKDTGSKIDPSSTSEETLTASDPLLRSLSSEESGIDFVNHIEETFENNVTVHINVSNGGGVAIADVNNDGLPDVYFVSSSGKNKLYLNLGGMKFKDITDAAGVGSENGFEINVSTVDINADGYLDFYVCRAGPGENEERRNRLFVNNKDLTFTERAKEYGIDDISASTGANFFDYDNDGDLDLYLLNYPEDFSFTSKIEARSRMDGLGMEPILKPKKPYDTDRFYRNDGPPANGKGGFKDVSKEAGINNFAYGLSVSVEDFNGDGWMDIYVGNDFIQPDLLYINNGNGTFTDRLGEYVRHTSQHTMGTELADFDNDGLFDIFAVDMLAKTNYRTKTTVNNNKQEKYTSLVNNGYFEPIVRNILQHNNGNGTFSDIGCLADVFRTDWSWSGLFADMDNDGLKDLFVTNGYRREITDSDFINFDFAEIKNQPLDKQFKDVHEFLDLIPIYKIRNFYYQNKGNWKFESMGGKWVTAEPSWSNGAAYADLDADGDLDYVVNNIDDPAFVFENQARQKLDGNYLQCKLVGGSQNTMGIGATVSIYYGDLQQYSMLSPNRGIFSAVENLLHFGLGKVQKIDRLLVRWPDGKAQTLTNVPVNQRLTLNYSDANETASPKSWYNGPTLLKNETQAAALDFKHEENPFSDFESYFLQPWKVSEFGPLMASADVNGDGLTDFYVGNAFNKPGGLYVQNKDGKFSLISRETWEQDKQYEDHGALFFDVDLDGDLDLYVVSGGVEAVFSDTSKLNGVSPWAHRLYINEGNNKFFGIGGTTGVGKAIPRMQDIALRVVPFDYDADGDLDLFIGGRVSPGNYPVTPHSYVLRNDLRAFVDVTKEVAPEFEKLGMITDLAWANLDSDPAMELVVVGEFMPLTVFKVAGGKLKKMDGAALGFDKSNGLWNRLQLADLDKDGDLDIVTGNFGQNSRYAATEKEPITFFAKDFDSNGSIDPVLTFYEDGKLYPLVQKDVLIKQMPGLKKRFIYAKDYAVATISDIFSQKDLDASLTLKAYMLQTCWWENQGGKFVRHEFPIQAQISPVFGIVIHDFNNDGNLDVLMAGNKYGMEVETNRCDSGNGIFLAGDGKGNFNWIDNTKSGFWAIKEVRDMALLQAPNNKVKLVVSNNNDKLQVYGN
ncbi:MAG: CRTAC1 family protein [Saprospiraceae bacterium]|nr:CRTAC1 family protein [Saprospiraceae bacterium]MCF8252492.1 CRTAC1 family protein [Saprospiraceae bacterium]MCF8282516.1 CRTAC1 family protein [Bacteroidales bacterium]MCF8314119.1 CRTAC1 family protein [Saprospiraceae bacterium]MCF8442846.1 CRTAC1 family protein [Saprospiraceae bacterium]